MIIACDLIPWSPPIEGNCIHDYRTTKLSKLRTLNNSTKTIWNYLKHDLLSSGFSDIQYTYIGRCYIGWWFGLASSSIIIPSILISSSPLVSRPLRLINTCFAHHLHALQLKNLTEAMYTLLINATAIRIQEVEWSQLAAEIQPIACH